MAKRNHVITSYKDKSSSKIIDNLVAKIPHVLALQKHREQIELRSSTIMSLDSLRSLERFNFETKMSSRFAASNQVIIHVEKGTSDDLMTIKPTPLSQYEYFFIEEEAFIRLLTFANI